MSDQIKYRLSSKADTDNILEFLRIHYYPKEPLTIGNSPPSCQSSDDEKFSASLILHGATIIAIDKTNKIVGCLLTEPRDSNISINQLKEANQIQNIDRKWSEIVYLMAYLGEQSKLYTRFNIKKTLYVDAIGVDCRMRGKSIGCEMMIKCFEVARSLNFPMVNIDCTSLYSIKMAEKLQMECVTNLAYCDYKDFSGRQVFQPPWPHTHIKTFVKLL